MWRIVRTKRVNFYKSNLWGGQVYGKIRFKHKRKTEGRAHRLI